MKLWIGKEEEGYYKGLKTLFVGSPDVTYRKIIKYLNQIPEIHQIYFGAGGCTIINKKVLDKCIERTSVNIIKTAEIAWMDVWMFKNKKYEYVNKIITFNNEDFTTLLHIKKPKNYQIKLQHQKGDYKILVIAKFEDFIQTDCNELEGKRYKKDVVLE